MGGAGPGPGLPRALWSCHAASFTDSVRGTRRDRGTALPLRARRPWSAPGPPLPPAWPARQRGLTRVRAFRRGRGWPGRDVAFCGALRDNQCLFLVLGRRFWAGVGRSSSLGSAGCLPAPTLPALVRWALSPARCRAGPVTPPARRRVRAPSRGSPPPEAVSAAAGPRAAPRTPARSDHRGGVAGAS